MEQLTIKEEVDKTQLTGWIQLKRWTIIALACLSILISLFGIFLHLFVPHIEPKQNSYQVSLMNLLVLQLFKKKDFYFNPNFTYLSTSYQNTT